MLLLVVVSPSPRSLSDFIVIDFPRAWPPTLRHHGGLGRTSSAAAVPPRFPARSLLTPFFSGTSLSSVLALDDFSARRAAKESSPVTDLASSPDDPGDEWAQGDI